MRAVDDSKPVEPAPVSSLRAAHPAELTGAWRQRRSDGLARPPVPPGEADATPVLAGNDRYPTWMRLALGGDHADPFCCTPAWQIPFHDAFDPGGRLVIDESQDAVLAFAQRDLPAGRFAWGPIETNWAFGCPLLGENAVERLCDLAKRFEEKDAGRCVGMQISGVRPQSTLARRLARTFRRGFRLLQGTTKLQCIASLAGGMDGYLSRRSPHQRKNLRREARGASSQGLSFERVSPMSPWEARLAFARMIDVERRSWKGVHHCGMAEPVIVRFYDIMLQWLSLTHDARVVFARHGDRDVGFIFGGMAGAIYRGQQFSFDDAWRHLSIGNLLQVQQIEWLCEQGAERYDMGPSRGARMAYKRHWTETEVELATWSLSVSRGPRRASTTAG